MNPLLGHLLRIIPKNLLSFMVGKLTEINLPSFLARRSLRWFANRYKLNLEEAEFPLEEYSNINKLFTRKLKAGSRPIGEGFVHPCDALLSRAGQILQGQLVQAKGKQYGLKEFLGEMTGWEGFDQGYYLTYYLCPTDYHRVHSPVSGKIIECHHLPGRLWPVNPWSVSHISQLFSVNERVVVRVATDKGEVVLVMVGATNVGRMTMSFDADIVSNQSHWRLKKSKTYTPGKALAKGDEIGVFNMGSTVIVLTPPNYFEGLPAGVGEAVKMGESLKIQRF